MKSAAPKKSSKQPKSKLIHFGYDEAINSLGSTYQDDKKWLIGNYEKFCKLLSKGEVKKSADIFRLVFTENTERFTRLVTFARNESQAESFLADAIALAAITNDSEIFNVIINALPSDFVNPRILLNKACYHAKMKQKNELIETMKISLACGQSPHPFLNDEDLKKYSNDSTYKQVMSEFTDYSAKMTEALSNCDVKAFKELSEPLSGFHYLKLMYDGRFSSYAVEAAAWHLHNHSNKKNAKEIIEEVISKTPSGILGESIVRLASENKHLAQISFLLDAGINPNIASRENRETPFARAKGNGCSKITARLKEYADNSPANKNAPKTKERAFDINAITRMISDFAKDHKSEKFYALSVDDGLIKTNSVERFQTTLERYRKKYPKEYKTEKEVNEIKFNTGDWAYTVGAISIAEGAAEPGSSEWDEIMHDICEDLKNHKGLNSLQTTKDFKIFVGEHKY